MNNQTSIQPPTMGTPYGTSWSFLLNIISVILFVIFILALLAAIVIPAIILFHWLFDRGSDLFKFFHLRLEFAIEERREKKSRSRTSIDTVLPTTLQGVWVVEQCAICLDLIALDNPEGVFNVRVLPCHHTLHQDCYRSLRLAGWTACPLCREPIC